MSSPLIERVEKEYNARYVGYYDLPDREGPFHVFWQDTPPHPDYDNYFAIFGRLETLVSHSEWATYITGARSIRDAVFSAYEYEPGKFICSRHRHNFVKAPGGQFLDGGLAYIRGSVTPSHTMRIVDGVEVFTKNAGHAAGMGVEPPLPTAPVFFNVRVKFQPDPDSPTWDVQLEKLRGWQTLAYHINDRDDAIVIGRALAAKYDRELLIDEDEQQ